MNEDVIYVARRKTDGTTTLRTGSRNIKAYTTRGRGESALKSTFMANDFEIVEYVPKRMYDGEDGD